MEEIEIDWIQNFKKIDKEYCDFYKTDILKINICGIFVNSNSEIEKIKNGFINLKSKNEITASDILMCNKQIKNRENKYILTSFFKYNIDLDPIEIKTFIKNPSDFNFFQDIKKIESIKLNKTIKMFQKLNCIYFIFTEKQKHFSPNPEVEPSSPLQTTTKKIYLQKVNNSYKYRKTFKNIPKKHLYTRRKI